jgi:hypothetical protein
MTLCIKEGTETNSWQHANTVQDIFNNDCCFKTPSANVAIQQRPLRRKFLMNDNWERYKKARSHHVSLKNLNIV